MEMVNIIKFWVCSFLLANGASAVPVERYSDVKTVEKVTAVAGETFVLECPIIVQNGEICQWTKDGFGLGTDASLPGFPRLSLSDKCNLKFHPLLVEDEGKYSCQIGQPARNVANFNLQVESRPGKPFIVQGVESDLLEVSEGDHVNLECRTQGAKPPGMVTWRMANVARELDEAAIRCSVSNSEGSTDVTHMLTVHFDPKILIHPKSQVALKDDKKTFLCVAEGNPSPKYIWLKRKKGKPDEVVGVSPKLHVVANDDTEATYVCKVFVEGHPIIESHPATLELIRTPIIEMHKQVEARIGDDVVLQCKVHSLSKETTLTWTKHGIPISQEEENEFIVHQSKEEGHITSDLVILELKNEDFMDYGCFAANEVGTAYKTIELMMTQEWGWLSIIVALNLAVGLVVFSLILFYRFTRIPSILRARCSSHQEIPQDVNESLPPIYKGEDNEIFDELLLTNEMYEEYNQLGKEYSDNKLNEKKIDLRIV